MSSTTAKTAVTAAAQKKGRKSALSPETVEYLKSWMMSPEHIAHPYPTDHEKSEIMADTSIELKQLTNWFVNNRKRFWKPRVLDTKLLKKKFPRSDPGLVNGPGVGISPHPVFRGRPGLSIIVPQMNPKPQGARPIPSSAAPLYAQGTKGVKPAPAHNHPKIFGPAGIVASVNSPFGEDDLHTISDGSGSSACNSDDESVAASTPSAPIPIPLTLLPLSILTRVLLPPRAAPRRARLAQLVYAATATDGAKKCTSTSSARRVSSTATRSRCPPYVI